MLNISVRWGEITRKIGEYLKMIKQRIPWNSYIFRRFPLPAGGS